MPVTANKLFRINVSTDNLTATLSLNGDVPPSGVSAEQIEKEITDLGIQIDEQSKKNIAQFAATSARKSYGHRPFLLPSLNPFHNIKGGTASADTNYNIVLIYHTFHLPGKNLVKRVIIGNGSNNRGVCG